MYDHCATGYASLLQNLHRFGSTPTTTKMNADRLTACRSPTTIGKIRLSQHTVPTLHYSTISNQRSSNHHTKLNDYKKYVAPLFTTTPRDHNSYVFNHQPGLTLLRTQLYRKFTHPWRHHNTHLLHHLNRLALQRDHIIHTV